MSGIPIYEFDALVASNPGGPPIEGTHAVPARVFHWLEEQCLLASARGEAPWLRLVQRRGKRAVQVTSYVGVIRAPNGFQIEVLPKVGKAIGGGQIEARQLLIDMLSCLHGFRHIQTGHAKISAARMPLLEIFIAEFLLSVQSIVKRGLRGDYRRTQGNLFAMRGKWLVSVQVRHNLCRADRFFTEHDEFTADRPENRLLRKALQCVLDTSASQTNHRLARELEFVFADVPASVQPDLDFQQVNLGRDMGYYADSLSWARLILEHLSPLAVAGENKAPSLLFPMELVFEAFVAKHLARQVRIPHMLKVQSSSHHLVRHDGRPWFRLKPDLLIRAGKANTAVLDTKWKLLDSLLSNGTDKYGLSQGDFYQLYAYGRSYLQGAGDVALVYPRTSAFNLPLPVFEFPESPGLRLWVLPFCLQSKSLLVPREGSIAASLLAQSHAA